MAETYRVVMETKPAIAGDSNVEGHTNWIRCQTVHLGTERTVGSVEKRELGAGVFHGLTLEREPDKASNFLFERHLKSKDEAKFDQVTVDICESGGKVNTQFILKNAYIKEFRLSTDGAMQHETLVLDGDELSVGVTNKDPKKYSFAQTKG